MTESLLLSPGAALMRRLPLWGKMLMLGAVVVAAMLLLAALAGQGASAAMVWGTLALCVLLVVYLLAAVYASLSADLGGLAHAMDQTARGNLGVHVQLRGRDELAELAQLLDRMVRTLSGMVANIRSNAALVAHAGQSIAQDSRALAERTEQQMLNRYRAGQVGYTDVVTAQASALNARRALLQLQVGRQVAAVGLVQALGGGWQEGAP